jgi:hypothetical protein
MSVLFAWVQVSVNIYYLETLSKSLHCAESQFPQLEIEIITSLLYDERMRAKILSWSTADWLKHEIPLKSYLHH